MDIEGEVVRWVHVYNWNPDFRRLLVHTGQTPDTLRGGLFGPLHYYLPSDFRFKKNRDVQHNQSNTTMPSANTDHGQINYDGDGQGDDQPSKKGSLSGMDLSMENQPLSTDYSSTVEERTMAHPTVRNNSPGSNPSAEIEDAATANPYPWVRDPFDIASMLQELRPIVNIPSAKEDK
jgi:hypothetical protein